MAWFGVVQASQLARPVPGKNFTSWSVEDNIGRPPHAIQEDMGRAQHDFEAAKARYLARMQKLQAERDSPVRSRGRYA